MKKKKFKGEIKFERILPYDGPKNDKEFWLFENGLMEIKTISLEEAKKLYPKKLKIVNGF